MPKIRQQRSTKNYGKPEKCGRHMTRSRTRKIIEGDLSIGQVRTGVKNGGSAASHRPQSSSSAKVCKNLRIQDDNNSNKKGQTGSRILKKKPGVSANKAVRNGDGLNGTVVAILPTNTMPKLHRSPEIISRPVQAVDAEPSLEIQELQAVTLNYGRRLQRLEANVNIIQHFITEVVPAKLDTIIVHADSLVDNLRERFAQDYEYLRERINHLNRALQQTRNNLHITIS